MRVKARVSFGVHGAETARSFERPDPGLRTASGELADVFGPGTRRHLAPTNVRPGVPERLVPSLKIESIVVIPDPGPPLVPRDLGRGTLFTSTTVVVVDPRETPGPCRRRALVVGGRSVAEIASFVLFTTC